MTYSAGFWTYRRTGSPALPAPPPVFIAPSSLTPASYILYVADASGTIIGEMAGSLESVSWATDGYGMATLILPLSAALAYGPLLEFGNQVLIEFTGGLPLWGGFIDVPRETTLGRMRLQMYEAGYLLTERLTEAQAVYLGSEARPATVIMADLARQAALGVGIEIVTREEAAPVEAEFHYDTLATAAERLRGLDAGLHYFIRPHPPSGGRIAFDLVIFRDMITDATNSAVLIQGHNLVQWSVLEQGPIYNEVLVGVGDFLNPAALDGIGDGYTELYTAVDAASQRRYGRRQHLITLPEVEGESGPGRARAAAQAKLSAYSKPRLRVRGAALNMTPGLFREYGIGTRVRIEASTPMATSEELVVIGMSYQPGTGTLSLVFDDGGSIGG